VTIFNLSHLNAVALCSANGLGEDVLNWAGRRALYERRSSQFSSFVSTGTASAKTSDRTRRKFLIALPSTVTDRLAAPSMKVADKARISPTDVHERPDPFLARSVLRFLEADLPLITKDYMEKFVAQIDCAENCQVSMSASEAPGSTRDVDAVDIDRCR
jgi:hypothetical protein